MSGSSQSPLEAIPLNPQVRTNSNYLERVNASLPASSYQQFIDAVEDFRAGRSDPLAMIAASTEILRSHPTLISGLTGLLDQTGWDVTYAGAEIVSVGTPVTDKSHNCSIQDLYDSVMYIQAVKKIYPLDHTKIAELHTILTSTNPDIAGQTARLFPNHEGLQVALQDLVENDDTPSNPEDPVSSITATLKYVTNVYLAYGPLV